MRYENMKRWVLRHQDAALSVPDKTGSDQRKRPGAFTGQKSTPCEGHAEPQPLELRQINPCASRASCGQCLCSTSRHLTRSCRFAELYACRSGDIFDAPPFLHRIRERDDSQQHSGCDSDYFCHRTSSSLPRRAITRQAVACLLGQIRAKSGCLSPRGQMIEQIHRQREHHSRGALACDVVQRCEIA